MKPKPAGKVLAKKAGAAPAKSVSPDVLHRETEVWRRIAAGEHAYAEGRVVTHEVAADRIRSWVK